MVLATEIFQTPTLNEFTLASFIPVNITASFHNEEHIYFAV